jgi:hypothetical protein
MPTAPDEDRIYRIDMIAAAQMPTSHHLRKWTGFTGYPPPNKGNRINRMEK